jgi:hypothetical protein
VTVHLDPAARKAFAREAMRSLPRGCRRCGSDAEAIWIMSDIFAHGNIGVRICGRCLIEAEANGCALMADVEDDIQSSLHFEALDCYDPLKVAPLSESPAEGSEVPQ